MKKIFLAIPIDNNGQCIVMLPQMNELQNRIASLEQCGWTLAAIGRAIGVTPDAVGKWKRNERYPKPDKPILNALEALKKEKPPKMKVYSNKQGGKSNG